jgi:hypothetical protein
MLGFNAKTISLSELALSTSESIFNSSGPMPSNGERTPPQTWYTPLNPLVLSKA